MIRVLEANVDDKGYGGVFAFVKNMIESINHQKFTLDICAFEKFDDDRHKEIVTKYGGKVYDCWGKGNFLKKQFQTCLKFYQILKNNHYEVVHIHSDVAYKLLLYGLVAKVGGIKTIIVHSHSSGVEGRHRTIKKVLQMGSKPFLSHMEFSKFACSDIAAQWMYENPDHAVIIKNGIITKKYIFSESIRSRVRHELGVTREYLPGTVGRFNYPKNPFYLLDIINSLMKADRNIKFLWIGSGDLKEAVEDKAKSYGIYDRIIFLGNTDRVNEYYQAMDCFVLPSRFEGLPLVLAEAQAAGLPIVISDRITKDACFTCSVDMLPIEEDPSIWANQILNYKGIKRKNMNKAVTDHGFDMMNSIRIIEQFYSN